MTELFDTHAHLDDEQLADDLPAVLARAAEAGVMNVVAVGTTAESSSRCVQLARRHGGVGAAVGIQPNYGHEARPGDWERIEQLAMLPQVVAIGETGLDRYWDFTPLAVQQELFDRHLRLAQAARLPFVVHMRDSMAEILVMLYEARRRGPLRGVMHSYTGDVEAAGQCVELGLHISFAGMVTFKKSDELRAVAASVPNDRLLIETDAPYLSPHPKRGVRPNEPALLVHTAACLADVCGMALEQFAAQTTQNARELFRRD